MHNNKNLKLRFGFKPKTKSGRVILRPVDQTPVGVSFKNEFGWFDNDVTMLMKASDGNNRSAFEALANRLAMFDAEGDSGKSVQQLFDEWRPVYIQTASELQAWPAYLKSFDPDVYDRLYGDEDRRLESQFNNTTTSEFADAVSQDVSGDS